MQTWSAAVRKSIYGAVYLLEVEDFLNSFVIIVLILIMIFAIP